MVVLIVVIIAN